MACCIRDRAEGTTRICLVAGLKSCEKAVRDFFAGCQTPAEDVNVPALFGSQTVRQLKEEFGKSNEKSVSRGWYRS